MNAEDDSSSSVLFDIVDALARDQRDGRLGRLESYLDRFPGYESLVVREYHLLTGDGSSPVDVPSAPGAEGSADPLASERPPSSPDHDSEAFQERMRRLREPVRRGARFVDEGTIARGGMGVVHQVRDIELDRTLAMKRMRTAPSKSGSLGAARFLEEAQVTAQLDHPGIVPVHEVGVDEEGRLFFAMKLVRGRDLRTILDLLERQEEGWNLPRLLTVLLRVCDAMAFAHSKGVIHRDLKPSNIMVGAFGEVYVMDWGLARYLGRPDLHDLRIQHGPLSSSLRTVRREERESDDSSPLLTMDGDVVGTPAYMSPEQARGDLERLSPRSDVYSIGAILYHALTGQAPFVPPRTKMPAQSVLWRVIEGPPTPVAQLRSRVPAELVAIQEKAMARDSASRYRDTGELGADLQAYLEQRVVRAYRSGPIAELRKWVARNRRFAGAVGAALFLLLAGLTASLIFRAGSNRNAVLAFENARVAELNAKRADLEATAARDRADEVLRLSALQRLEDFTAEADRLWPAYPEQLPRYEEWLRRAHKLVAELPDHERRLTQLRDKAVPETMEALAAHRSNHPKAAELERAKRHLESIQRLRTAVDSSEPPSDPTPEEVGLGLRDSRGTASDLRVMAWDLIDPEREDWGGEAKGLVLARRASSVAGGLPALERARVCDTLAWALFANGRFAEAVAEEEHAVEEAGSAKAAFEEALGHLHKRIEAEIALERDDGRARQIAELEQHIRALDIEIADSHEWSFTDEQDRWWHNQLAKLVSGLSAFADPRSGLVSGANSSDHGWGVERRAEFARSIAEASVVGEEASRRWAEAIASIANPGECPSYRGLRLSPQIGLRPIGRDPHSGLWEFAHVPSGKPAERDSDGELLMKAETGLVLVLLPGGTFRMGAQRTDRNGDNYDPFATPNEGPVHEVLLSPFFLSKYEMTQGQWQRFVDRNPSQHSPNSFQMQWNRFGWWATLAHPVERVSWRECTTVLTRMGLELPSEAQWEYGARAGATSTWWPGDDKKDVAEAGNVADAYAKAHGAEFWGNHDLDLDDGNTVHAQIGSYRPNAFGLHDVIGNVLEWCRDGYWKDSYGHGPRQDPVVEPEDLPTRVARGGSFADPAIFGRSAHRIDEMPDTATDTLGVRPALALRTR